jgi:hypothetical protein
MAWRNLVVGEWPIAGPKIEPTWCCPDHIPSAKGDGHSSLSLLEVLKRPDGALVALEAYSR